MIRVNQMLMKPEDNFSTCATNNCSLIVEQKQVPVFQNKVFPTRPEALQADKGKVELVQSDQSGFIFNRLFNPAIMNYDENYQNEQGNSAVFRDHLNHVLDLLKSLGVANKKIVEIGSGKGAFFEMMLREGFDCTGYDPTYEGNNPRIIKDYFSSKYTGVNADVIIMRHTLEHIPQPFSFIHTIAQANDYQGFLFVEVPTFDWIAEKKSFWDVFYEHCNYFTENTLALMFGDATTGSLFGGQYIYLWADLSLLRPTILPQKVQRPDFSGMQRNIDQSIEFIKSHPSIAVWGAGGKGSTYLNLIDPGRTLINYVIDINPAKQSRFIACTGHAIHSPQILDTDPVENILVMNEIYLPEIRETVGNHHIHLFNL